MFIEYFLIFSEILTAAFAIVCYEALYEVRRQSSKSTVKFHWRNVTDGCSACVILALGHVDLSNNNFVKVIHQKCERFHGISCSSMNCFHQEGDFLSIFTESEKVDFDQQCSCCTENFCNHDGGKFSKSLSHSLHGSCGEESHRNCIGCISEQNITLGDIVIERKICNRNGCDGFLEKCRNLDEKCDSAKNKHCSCSCRVNFPHTNAIVFEKVTDHEVDLDDSNVYALSRQSRIFASGIWIYMIIPVVFSFFCYE